MWLLSLFFQFVLISATSSNTPARLVFGSVSGSLLLIIETRCPAPSEFMRLPSPPFVSWLSPSVRRLGLGRDQPHRQRVAAAGHPRGRQHRASRRRGVGLRSVTQWRGIDLAVELPHWGGLEVQGQAGGGSCAWGSGLGEPENFFARCLKYTCCGGHSRGVSC